MAKKDKKFPYKHLQPSDLEALERLETSELIKRFISENNNVKAQRRLKRDDNEINRLKTHIGMHMDKHLPKEHEQMKNKMKQMREEAIGQELTAGDPKTGIDLKAEKKDLEKDYSIEINRGKELVEVINNILDRRNTK